MALVIPQPKQLISKNTLDKQIERPWSKKSAGNNSNTIGANINPLNKIKLKILYL